MDVQALYHRLPIGWQNAAVSLAGWRIQRRRFDRRFAAVLEECSRRTFWDRRRMAAYRDLRLQQVIEHAFRTVPYYRDLAARRRLK